MKHIFIGLNLLLATATMVYAQQHQDNEEVIIKDQNFKTALLNHSTLIDTDGDGKITYGEAKVVEKLSITYANITDLTGIDAFIGLKDLNCQFNKLTTLDVSKNTALENLSCFENKLTNINVSSNKALKNFDCSYNSLTHLDLSNNPELVYLKTEKNTGLIELDLSKNKELKELYCGKSNMTHLDVSNNTALEILSCSHNKLTDIDVKKNLLLSELNCADNQLTNLEISKNTNLEILYCDKNQLNSLNVSNSSFLRTLECQNNQISNLDLTKNISLSWLYCNNNKLKSLDFSKNDRLSTLFFNNNPELTQVNIANGGNAGISKLDARNCPQLKCIQIDKLFTPPALEEDEGEISNGWAKDDTAQWNDTEKPCEANLSTNEASIATLQIINPVKDSLTIKGEYKIEKIEIFNTTGQLVKVLTNNNTNVQDLVKGVYYLKIITNKGVFTNTIIKQ